MGKTVAALLVLALSALGYSKICSRCGYVKKHNHLLHSKQLQEVIDFTTRRIKYTLSPKDNKILKQLIQKESSGDILAYNHGCYGLGQGKKATYRRYQIPWLTRCPSDQIEMILRYVKGRYRTFSNAWKHHAKHNWY